MRSASAGQRAAAYLIDLALVGALSAATWPWFHSWVIVGILAVELYIVIALVRARTGRTGGSLALRIAATQAQGAVAPGLQRQFTRSVIFGLLHLTAVGPVITLLTSRDGQDWIDRIAGTASVSLKPVAPVAVPQLGPYGRPSFSSVPGAMTAPVAGVSSRFSPSAAATSVPAASDGYGGVAATSSFAPPAASRANVPAVNAPTGGVVLVSDTGERLPVTGVVVIGREPVSADGEGVLVLADPSMSMSRNHARVGVDHQGVWVEDSYSLNGTSVVYPDGHVVTLRGGQRGYVPVGCSLVIGDRRVSLLA